MIWFFFELRSISQFCFYTYWIFWDFIAALIFLNVLLIIFIYDFFFWIFKAFQVILMNIERQWFFFIKLNQLIDFLGTVFFNCILILLLNDLEIKFTFMLLNTLIEIVLFNLYQSKFIFYLLLSIKWTRKILVAVLLNFIIAGDARFFIK